ncbi:hypothetical protein KCV87_17935 [Actinosynnema pretiosum subsp. pretiosum]|uniref:Uncharacterized protein n=1 Tax=Actinosynnema pretiosum subsp. pretiosum TaxID=103721 RepID=A0AA45R1A3_9PSEU|nr:hypothetical protein APASM_0492 [Actinosynnema pretiosum subsp. pretiosum]QUF01456.1 hypothetical protein KCV87_17935 [Actinosynnema pretiosum subsp. pretiosum]
MVARGKPVAITEFGCATFRGAGDVGARAVGMVARALDERRGAEGRVPRGGRAVRAG